MTKWRKDEVAQGRRAKPVDRHNGTVRFLPSQVTVGGCRLPATKGRYLGIVEGAHQVRRTGREYRRGSNVWVRPLRFTKL